MKSVLMCLNTINRSKEHVQESKPEIAGAIVVMLGLMVRNIRLSAFCGTFLGMRILDIHEEKMVAKYKQNMHCMSEETSKILDTLTNRQIILSISTIASNIGIFTKKCPKWFLLGASALWVLNFCGAANSLVQLHKSIKQDIQARSHSYATNLTEERADQETVILPGL